MRTVKRELEWVWLLESLPGEAVTSPLAGKVPGLMGEDCEEGVVVGPAA
jgi:hypothetical protein